MKRQQRRKKSHGRSFKNDIERFLAYAQSVSAMQRTFRDLLADIELRRNRYRIHYAVDFATIYSYAHRISAAMVTVPEEGDEPEFLRSQIALHYLFNQKRKYVLLPPYALELKDHLSLIRGRGLATVTRLRKLLASNIQRKMVDDPGFDRVARIVRGRKSPADLSESEEQALVSLIEHELKAIVAMAAVEDDLDAAGVIDKLTAQKIILPLTNYFPADNPLTVRSLEEDATKWFQAIVEMRAPERAFASYLDGLACAFLRRLNERLAARQECILLVSHSRHIVQALRSSTVPVGGELPTVTPIRDLDYFAAELIHRKETDDATAEGVRRSLERLDEFNRLLPEVVRAARLLTNGENTESSGRMAEVIAAAGSMIENVRGLFNSKENLEIAGADFRPHWPLRRERTSKPMVRVIAFVFESLSAPEALHDRIAMRGRELAKALDDTGVVLNAILRVGVAGEGELRAGAARARTTVGDWATVEGVPGEPPLRIRFHGPTSGAMVTTIEGLRGKRKGSVEELRGGLISVVQNETASAEDKLLSAVVLACLGEWEAALRETELGLAKSGEGTTTELLFLKCVILRKLDRIPSAAEACAKALEGNPEDARLNREMAVLIWRAWVEQEDDMVCRVGEVLGSAPTLEVALRYAERAFGATSDDKLLRAHVSNTLAYLHAELGNVEEAQKYRRKMEKLPTDQWPGRFFDTVARIDYVAGRASTDIAERLRLFAQAEAAYLRAREDTDRTGYEIRTVEDHLTELKSTRSPKAQP